MKLIMFVTW